MDQQCAVQLKSLLGSRAEEFVLMRFVLQLGLAHTKNVLFALDSGKVCCRVADVGAARDRPRSGWFGILCLRCTFFPAHTETC